MARNSLLEIKKLGQSVWLDNLSRPLLTTGALARLVREDGISGITSNPKIFKDAMTGGEAYDEALARLARQGRPTTEIYESLAIQDIQDACDLLAPAYQESDGTDGFVSLEVSPHLARDTAGTVAEARRLWRTVDRPNLLIKIPGTDEGVPAIEACLAAGINVNITLLFSLNAYKKVIDAHMRALEARRERKEPLAGVASVASFFLSRIDVKVDRALEKRAAAGGGAEARALLGKAAVASAKLAYRMWEEALDTPAWRRLEAAGARVQKPLWASTSTKNPAYSDVMYVEPLVAPRSVNTMPEETIEAFRDHGRAALTIGEGLDEARQTLERLAAVGIDMDQVTRELVEEGIEKFVTPFDELLAALDAKRSALAAGAR